MRPATPKDVLKKAKAKAFLITNPIHVQYLSGLPLHDCCILALPKRFILFVDDFSKDFASTSARKGLVVEPLTKLRDAVLKLSECSFEADNVTISRKARWKKNFPNTKFVQSENILEEFRRSKNSDELASHRKAIGITTKLLARIPSVLKTGITEEALSKKLTIWALELGAEAMAFETIVGFGTHTSSPHHRPTRSALKKGDIVQIDLGVKVNGYCSDMSEVFFTARMTEDQERIYGSVKEAMETSMKAVKVGSSTHALDTLARKILKKEGIDEAFTHALGHGVGLEIHEGIVISKKRPDTKLLKDEVVTIEPGVYFPRKFGMRLERTVFVA